MEGGAIHDSMILSERVSGISIGFYFCPFSVKDELQSVQGSWNRQWVILVVALASALRSRLQKDTVFEGIGSKPFQKISPHHSTWIPKKDAVPNRLDL